MENYSITLVYVCTFKNLRKNIYKERKILYSQKKFASVLNALLYFVCCTYTHLFR